MIVYPNQKVVTVHKSLCKTNYMTIHNDDWINAFKSLKRATYGIYQYIASNIDGYTFALSRVDVMNKLDISKDSYIRGVKELIDMRYLVQTNEDEYQFYTTPPTDSTVCTEAYNEEDIYAQEHTVCMHESVQDVCTDAYNSVCIDAPTNNKNSNNSNYNNNVADAPTTITTTNSDKKYTNISEHDFIFDLPDDEFWKLQKEYFYKDFIDYRKINKYIKDTYNIKGFDCEILKQEINKRINDKKIEEIANKNMNDTDYDIDDIPDFLNTYNEFDRQLYDKQQQRLEEQEKEKNKKKIA